MIIRTIAISLLIAFPFLSNTAVADSQQYVRYEADGGVIWGELVGDTIHALSAAPYSGGEHSGETVALSDAALKAPVEPIQLFMTVLNFHSHLPAGMEPASTPHVFLVPTSSIVGPADDIVRPAGSTNLHYEAEVIAVVGKEATDVPLEEAGDYIFGVTAGNDITERDWQETDVQWTRSKGVRGFNVVGPYLVSGLDADNLAVEGRHNGKVAQSANTKDMIFSMEYMVHYLSTQFTLYPGDLIWSGTMGKTTAMEPGDIYEVELSGVGTLSNEVVQGK